MRLQCHFCDKAVSNEVPEGTVINAFVICPECVKFGMAGFQEDLRKGEQHHDLSD